MAKSTAPDDDAHRRDMRPWGEGMRRLGQPLAIAALAALVLLPAVPPSERARATPPGCQAAWQAASPAPDWSGVQLTGAASVAGGPAWVVGYHVDGPPTGGAWRHTPSGWQRAPSPWDSGGVPNAVSTAGDSAAWAVGERDDRPRVARWAGQWLNVKPPAIGTTTLTDVAAVSDVAAWVTGTRLGKSSYRPVVLQRTPASRWLQRGPQVPAASDAGLITIARTPAGQLWAGGWRADPGSQPDAWLVKRVGRAWQQVGVDALPQGRAAIAGLAFTTDNAGWLVGFVERVGGVYKPVLQRWDGARWQNHATPWSRTDSVLLTGVAVDERGELTVVGTRITDQLSSGVTATFDGSAWRLTESSGRVEGELRDAAPLAMGSLVVGMLDGVGAALATCAEPGTAIAEEPPLAARSAHDHPPEASAGSVPEYVTMETTSLSGVVARDVTEQAGLQMTTRTWGSVARDFDRDGDVDIFLNRHNEAPSELWLGTPAGRFAKSDAIFAFDDRHTCDAADVDNDGHLDVFCATGGDRGNALRPHELLLGPLRTGGTEATGAHGLLDAFGRGREAVFLDANGDAYPDLYVLNRPDRSDGMPSTNRLYLNAGGRSFRPAPGWGIDRAMGGECATAADIDEDGDDDLVVCTTGRDALLGAGVRLLINEGSRFADMTSQLGLSPWGEVDAEVADFDGDGRPDVATLSRSLLRIHLQQPGGGFSLAVSLPTTRSVAMAVGDVNGDDRPDVFVANHVADDLMLVNDGSGRGFAAIEIPQPHGSTEDVIALDYDGNGLTDFLSLNGAGSTAGPVMLIGFFER